MVRGGKRSFNARFDLASEKHIKWIQNTVNTQHSVRIWDSLSLHWTRLSCCQCWIIVRAMSNQLIHLVLRHVYVWTLPLVTIAAIRRGFWQEGDGAKYLCRPGARRGRSLPSSPFGRVGSFARRSCFERGRNSRSNTLPTDRAGEGWFYLRYRQIC